MRMELDKEADAAYVYFTEIENGEVAETISLNNSVNIDLDKDGKVLGMEILDASEHLPSSSFKALVAN